LRTKQLWQLGDVHRDPPRLIALPTSDGGSIVLATSQCSRLSGLASSRSNNFAAVRYFGRFTSKKDALNWVAAHQWLTLPVAKKTASPENYPAVEAASN
jgi:hypothetical protein